MLKSRLQKTEGLKYTDIKANIGTIPEKNYENASGSVFLVTILVHAFKRESLRANDCLRGTTYMVTETDLTRAPEETSTRVQERKLARERLLTRNDLQKIYLRVLISDQRNM